MPKETKFTLLLLLILGTCFGVIVWQRVEHQKKLLAAVKDHAGHQHGPGPGPSPFDQHPGGLKDAPPPRGDDTRRDEPRRFPGAIETQHTVQANPFDQNKKSSDNPFDQKTAQKPDAPRPPQQPGKQPPRDLFMEPSVSQNPPAKPAGFNPFDGAPTQPTAQKPPANPKPGFEAFPATQTKVQEPAGPPKAANPFDSGFPAQNVSQTKPPAQGGFPQGQPQQSPFDNSASNPFDSAGNSNGFPKQEPPKPQPPEQKPQGGFNPFTPVQHTEEEKTTPPQSPFDPFGAVPIPSTPSSNNKPAPKPAGPGPSPFDNFPLPENPPRQPEKRPEPEPQRPPRRPETPDRRPDAPAPEPGVGFPGDGKFQAPGAIDQQPARVYTVQADETYWSISRKLYGTIRYFQALAEHNRHRVGDPKNLRPGMKILVPEAAMMDKLYAKIIPGANDPAQPSEERPEGLFFTNSGMPMYRVGEEDTLSDIALKHLGRTTRWIEIYNLNRETLKTPDRLRVGTVLKMPSDASRIAFENDPRVIR